MKTLPIINCPGYRGAPQPPFNPMAINEGRFADGMRYKEYQWKEKDGKIILEWISQECVEPHSFCEEVKRCLTLWPSFNNKDVVVKMKVRGEERWEKIVKFHIFYLDTEGVV